MRPRNLALERELTARAAHAAGFDDTGGLDDFADRRAHPGGVHTEGRDLDRDAREELADARNYLVWRIEQVWAAHLAGDLEATAIVRSRMSALAKVISAWHDLQP